MSGHSYTKTAGSKLGWAQETASVFKILSDPTRCKILKALAQKKGEDMCVSEIAEAVGATHSATSHQLNGLEARGVLVSERMGQTICYTMADTRLARNIVRILEVFFS